MARKKTSLFEDIFHVVKELPWWAGTFLTLVSYFGLHYLASMPLSMRPVASQSILQAVGPQIVQTLSMIGQYILTPIFALAALSSAWRQSKRNTLIKGVASSSSVRSLNGMSWQEFELLVGESFRRQGFSVQESGGGGADGGVDLVLTKGCERFLVQCKQWRSLSVGVGVVRELFGLIAAGGATGGFVVTSGRYSKDAKSFAAGRNIVLIDGDALKDMIDGRRIAIDGVNGDHRQTGVMLGCPVCSSTMVRRVARSGPNAGVPFFGCSRYPACTGTR